MLEKLIGQTIKKDFFGKKFDVKVTNVIGEREEPEEYLDGCYTKEELIDLAKNLGEPQMITKVYGKIVKKYDIKKLEALEEIAKRNFYSGIGGCCSGRGYISIDFKNEMLLRIYRDGDEPENL